MKAFGDKYYLLNSRVLTHITFWVAYYIFFSLLWTSDGNYYRSFGLEFVLMPIRILASYFAMYYLIPRFLLEGKEIKFLLYYILVIILAGFAQRFFTYFFYELFFIPSEGPIISIGSVVRSMVLVNSTVLFLSAVKIFQYWKLEHLKNKRPEEELIEIRAEKRIYRVRPSDILYVEGLGNYVTYYLQGDKRLISYSSLKEVENRLPDYFYRIHKSFLINKNYITSYTNENVDIAGRILPIGKSVKLEF